jgi:hypothetical protein
MEKITVLTSTVPGSGKKMLLFFKPFFKFLGFKFPTWPKYGGHPCVTRSLVVGLENLKANFNFNPRSLSDLGETVVVLCGTKQLRQMIRLKKRGIIKKLLAGPNIVVQPTDYERIITSPEVDICITPSEWVEDAYEIDCPELKGRLKSWPAGVDTEFWKPSGNKKNPKNILFFDKRSEKNLINNCRKYCEEKGYNVETLAYGNYKLAEYIQAMERNSILVHFVEQESQGVSLTEAWSMDVPTIVWNPGFYRLGIKNYRSSSAPYLTEQTGAFFKDFEEFKKIEQLGAFDGKKYSARQWTLENLTDELSAQKLLDIITNS